jgi:uncharacterized iron-regulated membrane protein
LYQVVWRWHFYAALFVTPFILVFAVTGGIYLFKPQIEGWLYRDLTTVPPASGTIAPDTLLNTALEKFPGSRAEAYTPPADRTHSALVRLAAADGRKLTVALDPHTGVVLGMRDDAASGLPLIRELHGKLLLGKTGQAIQELAASWAFILVMTGLYLWWPRSGKKEAEEASSENGRTGSERLRGQHAASRLKGTLLPRLKAPGRVFWRDLHAVTGFWISGLLVFLIVTGLPWSVVSGALLHDAAARIGKGTPDTGLGWDGGGSRSVQSSFIHTHAVPSNATPLPLIKSSENKPDSKESDWTTEHAGKLAGIVASSAPDGRTPLSLSRIIQKARGIPGLHAPFEIRLPVNARGVFSIVTDHDGYPPAMAYIHLDQYTGNIIRDIRWKDFGPLAQAIAIGVALHEGRYFGLPNQLLGLMACVGLIVMLVAGLVMWWRRRPPGGLGAPSSPVGYRPGPLVVGFIIVLSVLMPLMGASLVVVFIGERLFKQFGPFVRNRKEKIS